MTQLLLAMPDVDGGVESFLAGLPAGDGEVSCLFVWYGYEQNTEGALGFEEFEQACRSLGRTKTIYGREYLTGLDSNRTMDWFRSQFAHE